MSLHDYLAVCQRNYDPAEAMLTVQFGGGAGIHTRIASGTTVHPTRDSLQYALALLQSGRTEDAGRAAEIIAKVLTLQDADALSPTYGVWPYHLEESLDRMNPPDWNWADFCGARIAQMLHDHSEDLPGDLATGMRTALGHAAWSIFRRNVALDYTNIAIMGGGVAAAAGEMLDEPRLVDFARERLKRVVALAGYHDSFPEYNSPTYTIVALEETERILHLCRDVAVRDAAEELRQIAWTMVAEHFHPETQEWAGPNSRSYADHIRPTVAEYLSERIGQTVTLHPGMDQPEFAMLPSLVPPIPCPDRWRERFARLPEPSFEIRRRFLRREDPDRPPKPGRPVPIHQYGDRIGTTWFDQEAVLGSVNHEDTWTQRRVAMGHFRTSEDPAVTLRLRFLHDGRDFASGFVRSTQAGPRVLSAITFLTNRGDWHPYFDHPPDDLFRAKDFRLRYELVGKGVRSEHGANDAVALCAGDFRALIHPVPGQFGDSELVWECGEEDGRAWVDGVCYQGPERGFDLAALAPVRIAVAMELLRGDEAPTWDAVQMTDVAADRFRIEWACGLDLLVPTTADIYPD